MEEMGQQRMEKKNLKKLQSYEQGQVEKTYQEYEKQNMRKKMQQNKGLRRMREKKARKKKLKKNKELLMKNSEKEKYVHERLHA